MKFSVGFFAVACLAASLGLAPESRAEAYPDRPVRVIVSFPAGSTPDLVARIVTAPLHDRLGEAFVVDNRSGASGNIGADAVAKAPPDGYTLLVSTNGPIATNPALYDAMPYDPERDLAPIALLVRSPQLLVVNNTLPVTDFASFVAYAKQRPGKLSYGSVGSGSAGHLTMEELKFRAGLQIEHVPYRGFPAAVTDLMAGEIQTMVITAPGVLPQVQDGRVKALAITSGARSALAPDLPTVAELGLPELESYTWIGLLAPAQTPPALIARLNQEVAQVLQQPDVRAALMKQGYEVVGDSPEAFARFIQAERTKWTAVIRRIGARVEQ